MRRVIVWRHGETSHNASGIWQGQLDTDLSEKGVAQARAAAAVLAQESPVLIVSSDLRRAGHTAAELSAVTGLPVRYDARLREIDVGVWQGLSQGDVAAAYPSEHEALDRGEDIRRGEHGESVAHVQERAMAAVTEVIEELQTGQTAVLATHGVTSRSLTAALIGMPQQTAWLSLAGLRNCHWAELAEHRTGWRLIAWNVGGPAAAVPAIWSAPGEYG